MISTPRFLKINLTPDTRITVQSGLIVMGFLLSFVWIQQHEMWMAGGALMCIITALMLCEPEDFLPNMTSIAARVVVGLMAGLAAMIWIRALSSDVPASSVLQATYYTLPFLCMMIVISMRRITPPSALMMGMIAAITVIGLIATLQVYAWKLAFNDRAMWPLQNPNHLAMVMNVGLLIGLGLMRSTANARIAGLILFLACVGGFFMTASRGGTVAIIPALIFFFYTLKSTKLHFHLPRWLWLVIPVSLGIIAMTREYGTSLVFNLSNIVLTPESATGSRPLMWMHAIQLIEQRPWFGYGTGTFANVYPHVITPNDRTAGYAAHNDFLQTWVELGGLGAFLYAAIGISIMIFTYRVLQKLNDPAQRLQFVTATSVLIALGVHAQIEFTMSVLPVLILMGLSVGVWIISLPADSTRPWLKFTQLSKRMTGHVMGMVMVFGAVLSLTQSYAEIRMRDADTALRAHDMAGFSNALWEAQLWSIDKHALPYLRAANFDLGLLMSGQGDAVSSPERVRELVNRALHLNPYLSGAYETLGFLDMLEGGSGIPMWQKGLTIEPRNANLRLNLLKSYEQLGDRAAIDALARETRRWSYLTGKGTELQAALERYPTP